MSQSERISFENNFDLPGHLAALLVLQKAQAPLKLDGFPSRLNLLPNMSPLNKTFFSSLNVSTQDLWHGGELCDYLHGDLRKLSENPKNAKLIRKFAKSIVSTSRRGGFFQNYYTDSASQKTNTYVNLGIPHGQAGALLVFSYLAQAGIKKKVSERVAKKLGNYLNEIAQQNREYFPCYLGREKKDFPRRNAWCYGDLAVGYTLLKSGCILSNQNWLSTGKELFRRGLERYMVERDGNRSLCHGDAGVVALLSCAQRLLPNEKFKIFHDKLYAILLGNLKQIKPPNKSKIFDFMTSDLTVLMYLVEKESEASQWIEKLMLLENPFFGK